MRLRWFIAVPLVAVLSGGCAASSAEPSRAVEALGDTPPPTTVVAFGDEVDNGPGHETGHEPEPAFEVCRSAGSTTEPSSPPSGGAEQSGYLYEPNIVYALSRTDLVVQSTSGQVLEDRSFGSVDGGIISYTPVDVAGVRVVWAAPLEEDAPPQDLPVGDVCVIDSDWGHLGVTGGVDWSTAFEDTADDLRFVGNDADELNRQYDIVRPFDPS